MQNKYNIRYKLHSGFCDNYFPKKRNPINEFRLDLFYTLDSQIIYLVMELMINDEEPKESKILNYITFIQIQNHSSIVESNLEQFIRMVKFDENLILNFKTKIQTELRRDISKFEYTDLNSDINYFRHLNNHYEVDKNVEFPIKSDYKESELEFWI